MSLVSFLVSYLNLTPSSRLRHLSIRSSSVDVSDLVSGLGSGLVFQPGSEIPLRQLSMRLSIVDNADLVFEPRSELPFATHVDQIELRGCFWCRF